MRLSLRELCDRFGGTIHGDASAFITGVGSLETAANGDITFAEKPGHLERVQASQATAVIVAENFPTIPGKNLLRVINPRQTFIRILGLFDSQRSYTPGVHPSAVVAVSADVGGRVTVCEHVVIRDEVHIGRGTVIESGAHIGRGVIIGEDCWIGPNVTLLHSVRLGNRVKVHAGAVIGGDGFGYLWMDNQHAKVPSFGSVNVDDDVEIGCNVCIDKATFGNTHIRRGAKIDNLVQIAHNNDIGEDVIIVSQVGLSGSVRVGKHATLAGQVGVADHIKIGDGATVAAASGVSKDVKPGEVVWGYPARPIQKAWRELASLARLPRLMRRLKALESQCASLEERLRKLSEQ
jgi:UDP-3-O-[3-hydroxymyristoyl] glucosamine N-acyltransferase